MIKVWILVLIINGGGGWAMNPIPPMADQASCEKVRDSLSWGKYTSKCVDVVIPAPSDKAYYRLEAK